jgi:hypothetical protein
MSSLILNATRQAPLPEEELSSQSVQSYPTRIRETAQVLTRHFMLVRNTASVE